MDSSDRGEGLKGLCKFRGTWESMIWHFKLNEEVMWVLCSLDNRFNWTMRNKYTDGTCLR